jgi:hypothetical protein
MIAIEHLGVDRVRGLGALQHLVHVSGSATAQISKAWAVSHEPAGSHILLHDVYGGQPVPRQKVDDPSGMG